MSKIKDEHASSNKKMISLPISRELFVQHLAHSSFNNGPGKETNSLSYSDLANTAEETETFHFLTDILPKKILARDYLRTLEQMEEEDADF
ncbi:putative chromatin accessibility complex protein 1 isoform 2 [Scophthalmus maximus]|uniref:Putative chromatin accessibility complex protein 1 isoform 2 n=1 Tax=Scophthalmus maximus TaxID=52904 RepID=A0A2U9CZT0_SCOMX|nr:putative chromatin accessibility complex protein 1 isoform 2 [Scophthalmus maximus]